MKKKLILISLLLLYTSLLYSKVKINVTPDFIKNNLSEINKTELKNVYIDDYNYYFLEDFNVYRNTDNFKKIREYFGKPGFKYFSFEKKQLVRHFYYITYKEKIPPGYYSVKFKLNKTIKESSFILYFIEIEEIKPVDINTDKIKGKIKKEFKNNISRITRTNINSLFKNNRKVKKIDLSKQMILPDNDYMGINGMEFAGSNDNKLIYRFLITDVGHSTAEYEIAIGLFCYIEYDLKTEKIEIHFTVVDFSIWVL